MKKVLFLLLLLGVATVSSAQTIVGDRLRLNTGPCTLSSGPGTPEGTVVGKPCDTYLSTTLSTLFEKISGTATNTGWSAGVNTNAKIAGNLDITGFAEVPGYTSQLTGWKIDNLGAGDLRYLYVDELHAKSFIADLEQALAGGQIISKSVSVLAANFQCPVAGGTALLIVEDLPGAPQLQVFQLNDWVVVRNFSRIGGGLIIGDCVGTVTSPLTPPGGQQQWTFTRGSGGNSGAMLASTIVAPKTLVLDYGLPGNGYYEVSAVDGIFAQNAPYSQTVTITGAPVAANKSLRTRTGNLRGISGGVDGEYGFVAYGPVQPIGPGNPLQGYLKASSVAIEAHNVSISLFDAAIETIKLNPTVPSFAIGTAVPTAFNAGIGIWMGKDSTDGLYKFRVGNPAANRIQWNGTILQIFGDGGGVTNINGSNIQTGTISADKGTFGSGLNIVKNSDCVVSTDEWGLFGNGGAVTQGFSFPGFTLNNTPGTCYFTVATTPGLGAVSGAFTVPIYPVVAGNKYEASVYLTPIRTGATTISMQWFNGAGAFMSQSNGTPCAATFPGGAFLASYCRSVLLANAPTGAGTVRVVIQTTHSGETNPFVFYVHAFFGEATANQSEASPWGPAGLTEIIGGMIRTNTINADRIIANSITAAQIQAGTITGNEISGNSINAGHLQAGSIDASKIQAGVIDATKLNVTTLSAITANLGTVTAGTLTGTTINGTTINGGSINGTGMIGGNINIGSGAFVVSPIGITHSDIFTANSLGVLSQFQVFALGGGGNRTVCTDGNGQFYAAAGAC